MNPLVYLEWFVRGQWRGIGWVAVSLQGRSKLRARGDEMARSNPGEQYRLASGIGLHDRTALHAFPVYAECPTCNVTGVVEATFYTYTVAATCPICDGDGVVALRPETSAKSSSVS